MKVKDEHKDREKKRKEKKRRKKENECTHIKKMKRIKKQFPLSSQIYAEFVHVYFRFVSVSLSVCVYIERKVPKLMNTKISFYCLAELMSDHLRSTARI